MPLYWIPVATVTHHHKFILSQSWRPEVRNPDVSRVGSFWEEGRGEDSPQLLVGPASLG